MEEIMHYIFYDIESDRIRGRVAEICKDYGLERIQFSGFSGRMRRNMREEIFLKIANVIGDAPCKVLILPVCERDLREIKELTRVKDDNGNDTAQGK